MSETTIEAAKPALAEAQTVRDSLGRLLTIKRLDALAELDLVEAAGSNAENRRWMIMATLAACVSDIDGTPTAPLSNRHSIRSRVKTVGSEGIDAVMQALRPGEKEAVDEAEVLASAKNSAGTP